MTNLKEAIGHVNQVILNKPQEIKLAFACILAGGHLLLNDTPGTGKTTLAKSLASVWDMKMKRVQFTSDLMPSDIIGLSIYNQQNNTFEFHKGPIFTNLFLADEINRASSRTQSSLLEVMAENQISLDGEKYIIDPFFVIATQNPYDANGTNMLPQAQTDRFMMCLTLGLPDEEHEKEMMQSGKKERIFSFNNKMNIDVLKEIQKQLENITISNEIVNYAYRLISKTRNSEHFTLGLSPRASISLIQAARAYAYIEGRNFIIPEDIKSVFIACSEHRLLSKQADIKMQLTEILNHTPVME